MGMPRRVLRAWAWKTSTMSAHPSGVLSAGVEPPPDSTDPSRQVATSMGSSLTAPRSAWVICPTFSSRVMAASSRSARARGWSERSIHGRAAVPAPGDYPIDQGITVTSRPDFARIDLSPYRYAVHRHDVGSVMPSFSSVDWTEDGVGNPLKMHAHRELITGVLKHKLGFDGFVISTGRASTSSPATTPPRSPRA